MFAMWYNAPGVANLYLLGAVFACGAVVGLGSSAAEGAEPFRPQDHG